MLKKDEIKELEAKYGKHNFCYQCGNPKLIYEGAAEGYWCPECGSSDQDE